MKKFSKIIACMSALSMCVSAMSINNVSASEEIINFTGNMGDVNADGIVDAVDASMILSEYAYLATGGEGMFSEEQSELADVNSDGRLDAIDSSIVLERYIHVSNNNYINDDCEYCHNSDTLGNNKINTTPDLNFSMEEIAKSPVKPTITVETITLTIDEARRCAEDRTPVPVNIYIGGNADFKYCSTGLHVNYMKRLSIALNKIGRPDIRKGKALEDLNSWNEYNGENSIFLATTSREDYGCTGEMYTINFLLPYDVYEGDFFPINIEYMSNENAGDLFTNSRNDEEGKLMQAYLFTQGITNGGIRIEFCETTTTPTYYRTTTTMTTTATTTTTTTAKVSETVKTGDANGDGKVSVADAVIIMQALANPEEFSITKEYADAADVVNKGDGITSMDALAIQMIDIGLLNIEDLPITSEKLQEIME